MAKKVMEPLTLHPDFGYKTFPETRENLKPLLPPKRLNPLPFLVPMALLAAIPIGGFLGFNDYIKPFIDQAKEETTPDPVGEEYVGETVDQKTQRGDCYEIGFTSGESTKRICVNVELWDVQEVGRAFTNEVSAEEPTLESAWNDIKGLFS